MTSDTRFFGNSRSVLLINPHKPYYANNELCLTEIDTFKGFCNAPSFNIRLQNNHELIFPLKAYVNYYLQSIIQSALYNLSFVLLDNWNISPCSSSTVSFNITTVYQVELSIYALQSQSIVTSQIEKLTILFKYVYNNIVIFKKSFIIVLTVHVLYILLNCLNCSFFSYNKIHFLNVLKYAFISKAVSKTFCLNPL